MQVTGSYMGPLYHRPQRDQTARLLQSHFNQSDLADYQSIYLMRKSVAHPGKRDADRIAQPAGGLSVFTGAEFGW